MEGDFSPHQLGWNLRYSVKHPNEQTWGEKEMVNRKYKCVTKHEKY